MPTTRNYPQTFDSIETTETKLPSGINVLTILTFIGCAVGAIFIAFLPMIYKISLEFMDKAAATDGISAKDLAEMANNRNAIEVAQSNIVPSIIINLIGIGLCLTGAIWMRKLKRDGYWLYVAGELLPVIGTFILLGTSQFTGVISVVLGVGIPLLFISLYSLQRKYLAS